MLDSEAFSGAILIDDPIKANAERYEETLKTVISNYENVLSTRINHPNVPIVLIMQRLHENDLSGYLLTSDKAFQHFKIPAIKNATKNSYDPRKTGDPLWPSMHSKKELLEIKKKSPLTYSGQYNQSPHVQEGLIIKKEWIAYYKVPPKMGNFYLSCDLNFKKEGSSRVAMSVYAADKDQIFLIDQIVQHMNFSESLTALETLLNKHRNIKIILIEDKANGPAMISILKEKGVRNVIPVKVDSSEIYRLSEVSTYYHCRQVLYPDIENFPWAHDHIQELLMFPNGKYDDRVDAETQFLKYHRDYLKVRYYNIGI